MRTHVYLRAVDDDDVLWRDARIGGVSPQGVAVVSWNLQTLAVVSLSPGQYIEVVEAEAADESGSAAEE